MGLIVAETALAVVLVVGASLMVKSMWRLGRVDTGFNHEQLLTLRTSPPAVRYADEASLRSYYAEVVAAVEAVPGVASLGMINLLPVTSSNIGMLWEIQDEPWPEGTPMPRANARSVSPGYFRTLNVPVLLGRPFDASDRSDGAPVMIVNETMARQIAPEGSALGRRVGGFAGDTYLEVVGVVGDIRQHRLDLEPLPEMYIPYELWSAQQMYLMIRTSGRAEDLSTPVRRAIWSVDEDVPISRVRTMHQVVARSIARSRFFTQLLGAFAALALLLGAIGLYGVMSYAVAQRTHEIGVRIALGASRHAVLRSIVLRGLVPAGAGVLIGLGGALGATRAIRSYLFGVSPMDPVILLGVSAFLAAVAVVASYVPARRASRVDPMVALRES